MIYALGGVSGANFNPAVTLALLISGKGGMTASLALVYMVMQVLGGFAAGMTSIAITGTKLTLLPAGFGYTPALIGETFYTFVLCFVVLNVACTTMPEKLMGGRRHDGRAPGGVREGREEAAPLSARGMTPDPRLDRGIVPVAGLSERKGWFDLPCTVESTTPNFSKTRAPPRFLAGSMKESVQKKA